MIRLAIEVCPASRGFRPKKKYPMLSRVEKFVVLVVAWLALVADGKTIPKR